MSVADSPILPQPEAQPQMVDAGVAGDMTPATEVEPQGVEVAGPLRDAIGAAVGAVVKPIDEFVGRAEERTYGPQSDVPMEAGPGGSIIIKPLPNQDLETFNRTLSEGGFTSGINLGRIGEIFDQLDANTQARIAGDGGFDLETVLDNIKQNNVALFQHLRRDKKTMDELVTLANATGFENIMFKFLNRKPGELAPAEDVLAGMVGVVKLSQELQAGARSIVNAAGDDALEANEFKKWKLLLSLTTNLAAQVSGNVSEGGRMLAVVSNASRLDLNVGEYAEQLDRMIGEMDDGLIQYHAQAFLSMENPAARAKYAEKGVLAKSYDFAMENYINALLSGFQTHAVNIAGNVGFQIQTLAERGVAGVIGNIRTVGGMRGEIGDQAYMGEATAEAFGLMMAQRDALTLMAKTFVTGESSDVINKIDLRTQRALGSTDNMIDIKNSLFAGDFSKSAWDTLGIATRLSGRFLATEDEYFKVITRRRVLYREAHRAGQMAYSNAIKAGLPRGVGYLSGTFALSEGAVQANTAVYAARQAYTKTMMTPPIAVQNMMTAEARKMTFQGQPEGFFGTMGPMINNIPGMKVIAPFYNTPTNIINEAFNRTLNWSPIYKALKQKVTGEDLISGKEFDLAAAKLALGNMIALTMYGLASGEDQPDRNIIITGYLDGIEGVMGLDGLEYKVTGSIGNSLESRASIAAAAGVPPYSIGVWNDELQTYEWTSFSRFDPLSALLAMGADMAEYSRYGDEAGMVELTMAYSLAVAEYAENMPFLQGVSELSNAVFNRGGSQEKTLARILHWVGKDYVGNLATNVAGNLDRSTFGLLSYASNTLSGGEYPLVSQTSYLAQMERFRHPTRSSTKLPAGDMPGTDTRYTEAPEFWRGFYEALQKAKARNPFFSPELKPALSFWGDEMVAGKGTRAETFNPMRTSQGELSRLDEELIRLVEIGEGRFGFHRDRIGESKLNADQFDMFVKTINTIDGSGNMPGDDGYDAAETLKLAMRMQLNKEEYILANTDADRFDQLHKILSNRRGNARKWMAGSPGDDFGSGGDILLDALRVKDEIRTQ
jgi:hypothetical protein